MEEYSKEDLKTIAIGQRGVCVMILIGIISRIFVFPLFVLPFFFLSHIVLAIVTIYFLWKLVQGLHANIVWSIIFCIIILLGFIGLLGIIGLVLLVFEDVTATNVLKKAGLHVGLLGVPKSEIDKL